MEIDNLKKAFLLFAGKDEMRPTMMHPFRQNGHYFSTDAHSMIIAKDTFELGFEEQDKPNCMAVLPNERIDPIIINITSLAKQVSELCTKIPERIECKHCGGTGIEICNLRHEHDCKECDGYGDIPDKNGLLVPDPECKFKLTDAWFFGQQLYRFVKACQLIGIDQVKKISGENPNKGQLFELTPDLLILVMPLMYNDSNQPYINLSIL